ncbi:MAG TPA: hypothetical protein VHY09_01630 [Candidatus Methylacidiphilales bacterium]|jgi:hypothetical protein|nr:hypothetical protein [Candidatus Methylacidiphilales bacterium]
MSADHETLAEKQRRLAGDIARQRTQLAAAYRDIAKPVLYTEYGLRGLGFLRSNPWILTVIPAGLTTTNSVIAIIRNFIPGKAAPKKAKWFGNAKSEAARDVKRGKKTIADHARNLAGHGWKAFKIYRRVRKFFP